MSDCQKIYVVVVVLDYVEDGMMIGLGFGLMAEIFVKFFVEWVKDGLCVKGVLMFDQMVVLVWEFGIEFVDVDYVDYIVVIIDGVDEVDGCFQLIKGGGG